MSEKNWHQARLIPTSGIGGADEQERRATSALLAVLTAVKEFGRAVTQPLGAPAGRIEAFIEVPFDLRGAKVYPDGLIRVTRGRQSWTALVEVKTMSNDLRGEQVENYLDVARQHDFDAVLTISNEIPPGPGMHPTKVDGRKTRRVRLHHLSWMAILTEAVMQREHRGVADVDQAWILGELIRYLEHPRSGAMEFEDMGAHWVALRDAVAGNTLRAGDACIDPVAARFDALVRYCALRLGRSLGEEVTPVLPRRERSDPAVRAQTLAAGLVKDGSLAASLRIPGAVADVHVCADLRRGRVITHLDLDAPREGRPRTRVTWLLRQLRDAPADLRVEAFALHSRTSAVAVLKEAVDDPQLLVVDATRDLRSFRVSMERPMGPKRGRGRGGFVDSVTASVEEFYAAVVQNVRSWQPSVPKMRELDPATASAPEVRTALVSTALSSQDGTETSAESAVVVLASSRRCRVEGETLDDFIVRNGTPRSDRVATAR